MVTNVLGFELPEVVQCAQEGAQQAAQRGANDTMCVNPGHICPVSKRNELPAAMQNYLNNLQRR